MSLGSPGTKVLPTGLRRKAFMFRSDTQSRFTFLSHRTVIVKLGKVTFAWDCLLLRKSSFNLLLSPPISGGPLSPPYSGMHLLSILLHLTPSHPEG